MSTHPQQKSTCASMYRVAISIIICTFVIAIRDVKGATSSAIPNLLYNCYANTSNLNQKQPLTLQAFIELIRKLETGESAINARLLTTSMLHGVILDGVRKTQGAENLQMIPFRATGEEFYAYKLLVDYLTSGESLLFPAESLTSSELCFLHMMLSSTVDPRSRGDESTTCIHQSSLPFELAMDDTDQISACPIKKGVIRTKWGSVSAGYLIKAIASALQKSTVTYQRVEEAINNGTNDNNVTVTTEKDGVSNIWLATIAGNLATVILKQISQNPEIGSEGFWNDTLLPRVYYLKSLNWDMTEADILGGIDGLAIARYLENNDINGIRVSQLIDMFYSDRGIMNNVEYKVTNRSLILNKLLNEVRLEEQVANSAGLLQEIGTFDSFLDTEQINNLAHASSRTFREVAGNITKIYDNVESIHGLPMKSEVEVIMIIDGSYDSQSAKQIIHGLSQTIHVSQYGSRLGVINGQSGNWMANVTRELFQLFSNLESAREWPSTLSLSRSLESVIYYYQSNSGEDCSIKTKRPMAKSIIILSNAQLTDNDFKASRRAFNSIKNSSPETSFILVTSSKNETSLMELARNFWDNDHILSPSENTHSLIQNLEKALSKLPGNIINFFCKEDLVHLEDYITPERERVYQIRREYTQSAPIVAKFGESNQGKLLICAQGVTSEMCANLTVNGEISFNSRDLCGSELACELEFRISVVAMEASCLENACRYPDQIRLGIVGQRSSGYVPILFSHPHYVVLIGLLLIL